MSCGSLSPGRWHRSAESHSPSLSTRPLRELGVLHDFLWAALLGGVFAVLINLVPFRAEERRGGPLVESDGRLALDAFKAARALR